MDDQKLDKILKNMDTPAIDANAKKRALNLAMAEFDSVQKEKNAEKEKKFQGFQILSRLMGISNTETNKRKRNAMEQKSHKKFIYGGMATAAAAVCSAKWYRLSACVVKHSCARARQPLVDAAPLLMIHRPCGTCTKVLYTCRLRLP